MKKFVFLLIMYLLPFIINAQDSEILTEQQLKELEKIFYNNYEYVQDDFANIPNNVITGQFSYECVYRTTPIQNDCRNLIIVDSSVLSNLSAKIIRYAYDLSKGTQKHIAVLKTTNATKEDIKNLIISFNSNIEGVVLIGKLDYAVFEQTYIDDNKPVYSYWPCELYFADLDGVWIDSDGNGRYDDHTGNIAPEIIIGRIPIVNNNSTEIEFLSDYLDKIHNYWIGLTSINKGNALDYRNKDWINKYGFDAIKNLYGINKYKYSYTCDGVFGKNDYCNLLLSGEYEFIQLSAHSGPSSHTFNLCDNKKEYLKSENIAEIEKDVLGLNLFCCSSCNWSKVNSISNLLAGSYLYINSNVLSIVGSTKTGSMLGFSKFYQPLSENKSMGLSLKSWWNDYGISAYDKSTMIHWFYGLSIIGDPFITFIEDTDFDCPDTKEVTIYFISNDKFIYYRANKELIITANFENAIGKHIIFDAPIVKFSNGFYLPSNTSMEILQD